MDFSGILASLRIILFLKRNPMELDPVKNMQELLRHALTTSKNLEECERVLKMDLNLLAKHHGQFKATPASFVQGLVEAIEYNKEHLTKDYKDVIVKIGTQVFEEFFGAKASNHGGTLKKACFFPSLESEKEIINTLGRAKKSIDVCVFSITNNHLADALFDAHDDGVIVRVISDDECMKQKGSDIHEFCEHGIEVTTDSDPLAHMHNKFAIIDGAILINGSFNWTMAAVNNNNENVTIIEDTDLVQQYVHYFNKLWKDFEPNKLKKTGKETCRFNHRGKDKRGTHHW